MNNLISFPSHYLFTAGAAAAALIAGVLYSSLHKADLSTEDRSRLRKLSSDTVLNALFVFIIFWKLSPLIFSFGTVMQSPIALLYLPGGPAGSILGITAAVLHFLYSKRSAYAGHLVLTISFRRSVVLMTFSAVLIMAAGNIIQSRPLSSENAAVIDFELNSLDGQRYALSDFHGQAVILNFWASWCPPCRAEYPELLKLQEELGDRAVIIGVNLTRSEPSIQAVRDFTSDYDSSLLHLMDTDGRIQDSFGIRVVPTTFVLDSEGRLIHQRVGAVSAAVLRNTVP
ncbi:TlpA family protein disulfide reductase [Spirochaeta dissipatitropha]